ncbi:twin-arginine translocation signal domain-containing protein [Streptomyces sp. KL116D]|uniref:twin-arginine translocation signal domain-containing protein n=1 Tax=Streptomyces sp. KL116D TaxID=3045152 RepID=UPI0035560CE6
MCIPHANRRDFLRTAAAAAATALPTLAGPTVAHAQEHTADVTGKVALTDVRVFDGDRLTAPRTVVIENGLIGLSALGARVIDCAGATLLPGLIDAPHPPPGRHHPAAAGRLGRRDGASDMACFPPSLVDSLRRRPGSTDIRSAGHLPLAPGSPQSQIPGFPANAVLIGPDQALAFVRAASARVRLHQGHRRRACLSPPPSSAVTAAPTRSAGSSWRTRPRRSRWAVRWTQACAHDPSRSARQPALRRDGSALRRHGLRSPSPP